MARPEPKVIAEQPQLDGTVWQLLQTEKTYVITYQGQPFDLRVFGHSLGGSKFKYKRTSYSQLGTAQAQVRRFNTKFNTLDFGYITV
tara:strand:+ start:259 stop:519 length:261 start_codon:yes stop_codon:yes gene_type:complete